MRKFLLAAIFACICLSTFAQTSTQSISVKGIVIDSAVNKPLGYVTVALTDAATNQPVKSMLSKDDGTFELANLPAKPYKLSLIYLGYATKVINVEAKSTDIGRIVLSPASKQLKEVSIVAAKPLMKQEVDRISYDVLADPESKTLTALDMMRKVPLLSVDGNDAIKLRGSGNYKILLNGKESALMSANPSDILKAMPGTNIVKIEVITTPPAKYDAEGLAGIINIITQKKADEGYNGSLNANYNTVWGARTNLNLTVKQGKIGLNAFTGIGHRPKRSQPFYNRTEFLKQPNTIIQEGDRFMSGNNRYVSTELSYEADTLNLLTGTFNAYNNSNNGGGTQYNTEILSGVQNNYTTINSSERKFQGQDFGLNYQLGFKANKEQLLTVSYKFSNNKSNTLSMVEPGNANNFRQFNDAGAKEHTTQLDYVHPLKKLNIEAGGKMIDRNNFSNFRYEGFDPASGQYIPNPSQSNDFDYRQDVYSIYNSYTLKADKWTFKAGGRYERTTIDANFASSDTSLNQNFNNVIPSVSIQRSLKNSSLTFGFTQRIQRPGIYQLNPFTDRTNPNYVTMGNPALRPSLNNNFELSYGNFTKGSINLSASYSFANNVIQNFSQVNGTVTTTTFGNVGKTKNLGLDLNMNMPITQKLNVNVNAELMQVWLRGAYGGQFFTNSGRQGHVFTNGSYKFDSGYRIGFNVGFDSRYVLLQGTDNWYLGYGTNVSKEFFNKKLGISFYTNGPFSKYIKLDFRTRTEDFQTLTYNYQFYRTFGFSVNYKFGKLNSSIKKNQRGINNDDTSGGESRN